MIIHMTNHAGSEIDEALAAELRSELAVQRRTANELAGVLGITPHTVGRRLSGKSSFNVVEMATAAEWLGISTESLLRRAERRASGSTEAIAMNLDASAAAEESATSDIRRMRTVA
jgi:transcriptional regulator with XRE-family HTH domain